MSFLLCLTDVLTVEEIIIRTAVVRGTRPSLDVINGPADLVNFAKKWIVVCCQKTPKNRPSFDGKHCCCGTHLSFVSSTFRLTSLPCAAMVLHSLLNQYQNRPVCWAPGL